MSNYEDKMMTGGTFAMAPRPEFLDEITQYQKHMFGSDSLPNEIGLDLDGCGNIT